MLEFTEQSRQARAAYGNNAVHAVRLAVIAFTFTRHQRDSTSTIDPRRRPPVLLEQCQTEKPGQRHLHEDGVFVAHARAQVAHDRSRAPVRLRDLGLLVAQRQRQRFLDNHAARVSAAVNAGVRLTG